MATSLRYSGRVVIVTGAISGIGLAIVREFAYMETIDDVTAQDFRSLMEINTVSCLLASKYALPYLQETKGNIINTANSLGVCGIRDSVSYVSSKGAVVAMTKALAIDESKYGVRVNSVSPSFVWTPLIEKLLNQSPNPEATLQEIKDSQLLGRLGTPEEVAMAVLFLAADATFCTGLNLLITGGAEVGFGKKSRGDAEPSMGRGGQSFSSKPQCSREEGGESTK